MNKTNQNTNRNIREPEQTMGRAAGITPERIVDQTGLQTADGTKDQTESQTADQTKSRTAGQRVSKRKGGSPTIRPCTNTGLSGTADEESPYEMIPVADAGGKRVTLRPVPLYLIAPTLSREIQTYKGGISTVVIRRAGQHGYVITITTQSPRGSVDAD